MESETNYFLPDLIDDEEETKNIDITLDTYTDNNFERIGEEYLRVLQYIKNGLPTLDEYTNNTDDLNDDDDEEAKSNSHIDLLKELAHTEDNYYDILGLGDINLSASDDQIKTAYRKLVLKYHPDKMNKTNNENNNKNNGKNNEDPMFLKIKNAYEILSNSSKRRLYDSNFNFDEWIPDADIEESSFYSVFGPVFLSNSRFSEEKPVPLLGDQKTPINKVHQFYDFWRHFNSWREMDHKDLRSPDEFDNRYEKRFYINQNKKIQAKLKKKENERISLLVANAYKCDPRIINEKLMRDKYEQMLAYERQAMENEHELSKQLNIQIKSEEEAKRKKIMQERNNKAKDAKKKMSNKLTTYINNNKLKYTDSQINDFLSKLTLEKIEEYSVHLDDIEMLYKILDDYYIEFEKDYQRSLQELESMTLKKKSSLSKVQWTPEEDLILQKGVKLIPSGSCERWEQIASYFNSNIGPTSTSRSPDDCSKRSKILKTEILKQQLNPSTFVPKNNQNIKLDVNYDLSNPQDNNQNKWTIEQQQLFEQALRTFPKTMDPKERWDKIAKAVPGKTKKDCINRFKELKEQIKNK